MEVKNNIQCNIHNNFDIEVIDGKTGKIKQTAKAYNMVLNNLWHYIIETTTAFGTYIQYGSGTGTMSTSRTSLFTRYSGKSVSQDSLSCDYANKIITRRVHINLPLTEAVGVTITEVGLAAGTGDGSLTTHAALQDMNGNPISISKTELDIINIYATIYCHWTVTNPSIIFSPQSGLLNSLVGVSNVFGSFTGGFAPSLVPSYNARTWGKSSSSLANKTITYTMSRYSQSEGNSNGCQYLIGTGNYVGVALKQGTNIWSPFTITNESVGTGDGTTTVFTTKFSFPYNATVYLNGVAQTSGVTVKKVPVGNMDHQIYPLLSSSTDANNIYTTNENISFGSGQIWKNEFINEGCYIHQIQTYGYGSRLETSDDLVNWTVFASGLTNVNLVTIPAIYHTNKYFKMTAEWGSPLVNRLVEGGGNNNIVFDTAPAAGDVITIDYTTDCIPKDSDHVLDASITFKFGDYVPTP